MADRSYTATRMGITARASELWNLYRWKRDVSARARSKLDELQRAAQRIEGATGAPLLDREVLVVGPGQHGTELAFFGRDNRVIGIDLDVISDRPTLAEYSRMLRTNGPIRVLKTLGRRLTGIDTAYGRELLDQLELAERPAVDVRSMDAAAMDLASDSLDCVYSSSVFEHLTDPGSVIDEIARVLRPGGVAHVLVHLYTSDSGCHDVRIFAGRREHLPRWAHLRPVHAEMVRPNAYLNRLRLDEWRQLFGDRWQGVELMLISSGDPELRAALDTARAEGELEDFRDEELLHDALVALWVAP